MHPEGGAYFPQQGWKIHITNYFYPILRRYERLGRRRLTKAAADAMPDLLQSQIDKTLARIMKGPMVTTSCKKRQYGLQNAFDVWTKRKANFDTHSSMSVGYMAFMMNT